MKRPQGWENLLWCSTGVWNSTKENLPGFNVLAPPYWTAEKLISKWTLPIDGFTDAFGFTFSSKCNGRPLNTQLKVQGKWVFYREKILLTETGQMERMLVLP